MTKADGNRLRRCMGKTINHIEQAIPALAELHAACEQRDRLIAAQKPEGSIPEIDDNREPDPSYTEELGVFLQTLDRIHDGLLFVADNLWQMDRESLLALAQRYRPNRSGISADETNFTPAES